RPDGQHYDDDRDELQQHAKPHQLLRAVGRAAARHVGQCEQQHDRDGADRNRNEGINQEFGHRQSVIPFKIWGHHCPTFNRRRHMFRGAFRSAGFEITSTARTIAACRMNADGFSSRSSTIMSARVVVLGAAGRFGHTAAEAFRDAGWTVASLVRPGSAARAPADTEGVEGDALDHDAVGAAARGADVVLHARNPSYTDWSRRALPLAYSAITAAETGGATLIFPGNLYNFGSPLPPVIDENTPMRPSSRKGQLRVAIEDRMAEAAERGGRIIILRAGDFYGGGRGAGVRPVAPQRSGPRPVTLSRPRHPG